MYRGFCLLGSWMVAVPVLGEPLGLSRTQRPSDAEFCSSFDLVYILKIAFLLVPPDDV